MKTKWFSFILLLLVVELVFSCSVNKNYKTLSFFFDGVPDPLDTAISRETLSVNELYYSLDIKNDSTTKVFEKIYYHDPYQYKGCSNCHDSKAVGRMISDEPDLCYQCHEDFNEKYKFTHGPVNGGFCTACHNPHSSDNIFLLNDDSKGLCFYCHNQNELSKIDMHSKVEDIKCTTCHNPHGGDNNLMLVK